jgi:Ca2+/Na+ antiporter
MLKVLLIFSSFTLAPHIRKISYLFCTPPTKVVLISPLANADDIFSEVWDWAKDNPEISIPSAVVGVPIAVAAAPMIASYVLFPFALPQSVYLFQDYQ